MLLSAGLNDLEADVYLCLLDEDLLTGYKIGKLLGKPTANVYKAIDSLARKGALMIEDKQQGLCKAVPAVDFFTAAEAAMQRRTKEAQKAFTRAGKESYDENTYQLKSVDLTLEKCKKLVLNSKKIVVIDAFPLPLQVLMPTIQKAIARGVEVYLQVYEPLELAGAHIILPSSFPVVLEYWNSQQLNLVADGKEYVLALFNQDLTETYQATWSRNLYLSCMLHKGFSNEFTITQIMEEIGKPGALRSIHEILKNQSRLSGGEIPGVSELLQRFGLQQ